MKSEVFKSNKNILIKNKAFKEGYKESIQIFKDSPEFGKINDEGKTYPLKVQIYSKSEKFELLFSSRERNPSPIYHDFKFTNEDKNIVLNYHSSFSGFIYVGFYAKEYCQIEFEYKFSGKIINNEVNIFV